MDLYNLMTNINGKNIEEELKESILVVKEKLKDLTNERTCKIYSGYLLDELTKRHVTARLINSLDLGIPYEHHFLLIPDIDEYFLADLTFLQFNVQPEAFLKLLKDGYQRIDSIAINVYLRIISSGEYKELTEVEKVFYKEVKNSKL